MPKQNLKDKLDNNTNSYWTQTNKDTYYSKKRNSRANSLNLNIIQPSINVVKNVDNEEINEAYSSLNYESIKDIIDQDY